MAKTRQWTLFAVLGVVGVLVIGWLAVISPQRSHAQELRGQVAQELTSNDALDVQVESLRSRMKDLPAKQARLDAITARIPDTPALPALIRLLSTAADDSGVELVSLKPSPPAALTGTAAAGKPATAATAPAATGPQLQQIAVVIEVKGGFFNVEEFDAALEDLHRALVVDGFDIQAPANAGAVAAPAAAGAAAQDGRLDAKIQARVFMSTSVAPAQTAAKATGR